MPDSRLSPLEHLSVNGRSIAVSYLPGADPAIIWLGGFKSDMTSTKAMALADWCQDNGRAAVRFDYSGHGVSGGNFRDGTISQWVEESLAVIEEFGGLSPVLVGSSMGGWIAMLATLSLQRKSQARKPSALVLIAPATDFTESLMWEQFSPEIRAQIIENGVWNRESQYSPEPTPVTRALIEDGRKNLLFGKAFKLGCPVHILQGMQDPDVPWQHTMKLVEHLPQDKVALTFINDGDHRLSRDEDISRLVRVVAGLSG